MSAAFRSEAIAAIRSASSRGGHRARRRPASERGHSRQRRRPVERLRPDVVRHLVRHEVADRLRPRPRARARASTTRRSAACRRTRRSAPRRLGRTALDDLLARGARRARRRRPSPARSTSSGSCHDRQRRGLVAAEDQEAARRPAARSRSARSVSTVYDGPARSISIRATRRAARRPHVACSHIVKRAPRRRDRARSSRCGASPTGTKHAPRRARAATCASCAQIR